MSRIRRLMGFVAGCSNNLLRSPLQFLQQGSITRHIFALCTRSPVLLRRCLPSIFAVNGPVPSQSPSNHWG